MSFPGTGKIWMNGSLVDWADAKIHVASHVVHYGSGVFEGARCYSTPNGSACFRLDDHMRRLYDSAKIYRMEPAMPREELTEAVLQTIRANEFKACYIRPIVFRGYEALGVNPFRVKMGAIVLSGLFSGLAGIFYAQYFLYLDPSIAYGTSVSIESLLVPIIGGMGTLFGPLLGAVGVHFISEVTRETMGDAPGIALALYGTVLVLMVIFMPRGLAGLFRRFGGRSARKRNEAAPEVRHA